MADDHIDHEEIIWIDLLGFVVLLLLRSPGFFRFYLGFPLPLGFVRFLFCVLITICLTSCFI